MTIHPALLTALTNPKNFGRSIAELTQELNIEVGSTPSTTYLVEPTSSFHNPDPCPFTLPQPDYDMMLSVMAGLTQIFLQDRQKLGATNRFHPDKQPVSSSPRTHTHD